MEKGNNSNRVEIITSIAIQDPRDNSFKTAIYFNKFENGEGFDCINEIKFPDIIYPEPDKDEEGNELPVNPIYGEPYTEIVYIPIMKIEEGIIEFINKF